MRHENMGDANQGILTAERGNEACHQETERSSEFACRNCGCEQVMEQHQLKAIIVYERFVPCNCGVARDGQAVTQKVHVTYSCSADGYPDEEGNVEWDESEETIEGQEEGEIRIICEACYQKAIANKERWENAPSDPRDEIVKVEGSDEFHVLCSSCRHEVD